MHPIRKFLSYLLTPVFWLYFGLLLVIFHPIQVICKSFGRTDKTRKKAVDILNAMLLYGLTILGAKIKFKGFDQLPSDKPFIIVSNHQNHFDISPIVWGFRKFTPKFVSKQELGKGIPSISYNLRHGGSALIDRKNSRQAITEILKLGRRIEIESTCASIFPEGTRSKTGEVRRFKEGGLDALLKMAPSAVIVPLVIDGNHKLMPNKGFPLTFGTKLNYTALSPIDPKGREVKELVVELEELIKYQLNQAS
ncbi:1-acyl-sn-glycerol-3-phosphate acyltransferase [Reichenbachiella versicolor]|uniref:1-acyl-sn-glycerol-3-phosphate acyltransferase n=1 Tax=Reichenbachiella versicolor TaxID=1821036 RepID=UPI001FEB30A5|nr:1-acyl-sn-glycerol-3-phosphate acyltransferase [Reichenbachiella versicolor]